MTVRAKLKLTEIHELDYHASLRKFIFTTQYDESIPEDRRFFKYTPSGRFEMLVDNPAVVETFKLGKQYYVDFSEAE